jgi:hypothetical protein
MKITAQEWLEGTAGDRCIESKRAFVKLMEKEKVGQQTEETWQRLFDTFRKLPVGTKWADLQPIILPEVIDIPDE